MDKKYSVETRDVGVTSARFQIDNLHPAHIELINIMLQTHKRLIVVLGLRPLKFTSKNPLTFPMRKQAFWEVFSKYRHRISLLYLEDVKDDEHWSDLFDLLILKNIKNGETVRYCGGRDSFFKGYHNNIFEKWEIEDFTQSEYISATAKRNEITSTTVFDESFRRGVIYTTSSIFPQCVPSIDVAIFNEDGAKILLGRKVDEKGYRFIGSWVRSRETFEQACHRAVKEKANISKLVDLRPLKSFSNFDWRFKGERDDLTTMLYCAYIHDEQIEALGKFTELKWFPSGDILRYIEDEHYALAAFIFEGNYEKMKDIYKN